MVGARFLPVRAFADQEEGKVATELDLDISVRICMYIFTHIHTHTYTQRWTYIEAITTMCTYLYLS